MKYTIDNKTINIPNALIKEYNDVSGGELNDVQVKGFYMMAKDVKASNINKYIVDCLKEEIELIKMLPTVAKKISNGEISSDIE